MVRPLSAGGGVTYPPRNPHKHTETQSFFKVLTPVLQSTAGVSRLDFSHKKGRTGRDKAPFFKEGYGPGGTGGLLDELLSVHESVVVAKHSALSKPNKASYYWALYFKAKVKLAALRNQFLKKVKVGDGVDI